MMKIIDIIMKGIRLYYSAEYGIKEYLLRAIFMQYISEMN